MTNKEYIKLGWTLLEHKVRYYILDNPHIDDYSYDMLEKAYCKEVIRRGITEKEEPNNIAFIVGVGPDRPSLNLVIKKLRGDYTGIEKPEKLRRSK